MAKRKQLWHPDEVRRKIQASQLINRLQNNALAEKPVMDAGQIQCANILLRKSIPDLTSTVIEGNPDRPLEHKLKIEFIAPEK